MNEFLDEFWNFCHFWPLRTDDELHNRSGSGCPANSLPIPPSHAEMEGTREFKLTALSRTLAVGRTPATKRQLSSYDPALRLASETFGIVDMPVRTLDGLCY